MTQYAVLGYNYQSKMAQTLVLYSSIHWLLYIQYLVNTNCTLNTILYACIYKNTVMLL